MRELDDEEKPSSPSPLPLQQIKSKDLISCLAPKLIFFQQLYQAANHDIEGI
uniref:Uncharacterized protein n=1 Tax=Nelumbo nucifera TaxID=4432 RepID=A0A822Y1L9_NELNU|nr:TPA_asm: hypothetical protein HUJ06_027978 [Nelumbo nucifera]